jgi:FkbM family methyltransferase
VQFERTAVVSVDRGLGAYVDLARFISQHPLTRRAPISAIWRVMSWQVRSRLATGEITVPWIEGTRLVARRGMTGATGNIYAGLHEFADMAFLLHLLRPSDVFFDVGANIGSYSILASAVCGARTYAFEPDPDTVRALKINIAANELGARVTVIEAAVGDQSGEVAFTVGRDTVNRVAHSDDTRTRQVPLTTLDAAAGDACPTLIKIDIEGYEEQAVLGAIHVLQAPTLKAVQLETVTDTVRRVLHGHGFVERFYDPVRRRLSTTATEYSQANALWVRDPLELEALLIGAPRRHVFKMAL